VALVFQLRAIDKRRLKSRIGKIEKANLELLKQYLRRFNKWVPQSVAVFAGWGLEGFWRRFEG